ncbi:MAG: hypothetical protein BGO78_05130 [Chloroflexi bacterium 44-23]|mgnify:CR=1 FL=1|nr:MAG: hypothetical protein BGO78_05130 [Chloroflexi bacterium 44-23]
MNKIKTPQSKKKKGHGGMKYVLSSLSLISVIGFWQHFANNDGLKAAKAAADDAQASNNQIQFNPLPTLMVVQTYQQRSTSQATGNTSGLQLREATAPTAQPVTKPIITFKNVSVNNSGSGSSSSSPVTRSGSSH